IRYLDDLLKELDNHLAEQGIREETMLVLFGDHGESLDEHGIFWDHCGLYEQTVHVPLIIRWPDRLPAGRRVPGLVQQVDLLPTLLEAVRAAAPNGIDATKLGLPAGLDGRSLWPAIRGEALGTHERVYLSECAWQAARGVRTERYKYIRYYDSGPFERPTSELFDLQNDPGETRNLAMSQSEVAEHFQQELDGWVNEKLKGRPDPMDVQLRQVGLPFRNRIEAILNGVGLTWDEWRSNPQRGRFDALHSHNK
ncbi:MAG: sulfatase-like hydrolase/transferase, partial [Paenibacillaceae bacterium]|nr:sulfatase-like hydrolase/transferase [Paenibacillaceae bacterium]